MEGWGERERERKRERERERGERERERIIVNYGAVDVDDILYNTMHSYWKLWSVYKDSVSYFPGETGGLVALCLWQEIPHVDHGPGTDPDPQGQWRGQ